MGVVTSAVRDDVDKGTELSPPEPAKGSDDAPGYSSINRTTARTLRVLTAFLENAEGGYRVSALCKKLDMTKQSMIRSLRMLVDEGYVCKRERGPGYDLGYRLLELGSFEQGTPDLVDLALPIMQRLQVLTGQTSALLLRVGDHASIVQHLDGKWPLSNSFRKGRPMPLNIGAVSCAILACLSDLEIQDFIARHSPLPALAPNAISDPVELWNTIKVVRARGYGMGPVVPGISTLGFPIFGADERPLGAVSLVGHDEDILGAKVQSVLGTIQSIMAELNGQSRLVHIEPSTQAAL